jgi:hypothetical protein
VAIFASLAGFCGCGDVTFAPGGKRGGEFTGKSRLLEQIISLEVKKAADGRIQYI